VYLKPCWEPAVPDSAHAQLVPSFGWVKPVFPERFTIAHLLQERATMGPSSFAAQYLLNPVSADTTLLPREQLRTISRLEFETLTKDQELWIAMTVDPAITTNKWSDYSAIAVGAFDRDNVLYIVDLRRGKWRESELVREIYEAHRRTPGIKAIGFEKTGFQRIFMRLFTSEGERTGRFLPIVGLEKDTLKTKQVRIRALEPIWMNGQLVVVDDVPAYADFLEEAERFRTDRENAHDDLLDAVVDLLQVRARPSEMASPFSHLEPEERARAEFEYLTRQQKPWLSARAVREAWAIKSTYEAATPELVALGAGRHHDEFFS
jgi:predicted phage terminase large subunit-like protein